MTDHLHHRIDALLDLRRYDEAEPLLASALAQAPGDAHLHGMLARLHLARDEDADALRAAQTVVALAPESEWGHRLSSIAWQALGRPEEALGAAEAAVRAAPNAWQTHLQFAHAALGARGGLLDAQAAAERAIALDPENPAAHYVAAVVAHERGYDDQARAGYRRVLALDPEHQGALHDLTVLDSGGIRRTALGFSRVLRVDPGHETALANLDWLAGRFVFRLYWVALAGLLAGGLSAALQPGEGANAVTLGIAALLVLGAAAYVGWLVRTVPPSIRRYVAPRLVREPFLAALVILTASTFAFALVVCFNPSFALAGAAARGLGIGSVAMLVWGVARRDR